MQQRQISAQADCDEDIEDICSCQCNIVCYFTSDHRKYIFTSGAARVKILFLYDHEWNNKRSYTDMNKFSVSFMPLFQENN